MAWQFVLVLACISAAVPARAFQASTDIESLKVEADQAYRGGDHAHVIELTDRVLASNPDDHVALYLRASGRVELGLARRDARIVRQGITDAREAIRLEGSGKADYYLPYLFGMTNLSIIEGKPVHAETARSVIDQLLEKSQFSDEEHANLLYQRGLANLQARAPDAARSDFNEAIQLKSDHLAAFVALASATLSVKGPDAALGVHNRAVASIAGNPLLLNNRAMHFHSLGRDKDALSDFAAALKADPEYVPALVNRAYVLMQMNDADAAEQDLAAALEIDPEFAQAHRLRGTILVNQGRPGDAVPEYEKVCRLEPANGMAFADLAFAHFFAQDYAKALAEFNRARDLNPDIPFLTPWRLAAAVRTGQNLSSEPNVLAAVARPTAQRTWFDWLTLYQLGKITDGELLAAANPTDASVRQAQLCEAYYFIGLEMVRRKKTDEAQAFFAQALGTEAERLSAFRGARVALQGLEGQSRQ
ncbi:MAG: tetratricopeptide repeat protein [Planctomyces sp.]|nr:tetratricopeptide repeat protein [Planctomyces sp.]